MVCFPEAVALYFLVLASIIVGFRHRELSQEEANGLLGSLSQWHTFGALGAAFLF